MSHKAKALMILGTASDVGKSVIAAGLCRIFYRAGIRVAPFKAQNMSLNSYVTLDCGEIGWAQAAQAAACGIEPTVDMNPILLKPVAGLRSQVIVQGKVYGDMPSRDYYRAKWEIWQKVKESYARLAREFDLIVLEGAGGAAEINLREHDLANLRIAKLANAEVLLVGDIERGGVFASLIGTIELLKPDERRRIKGIIINKFRGDKDLLKSGLDFLERRTGIPVLGVVSYYEELRIPEEDSVALERRKREEKSFSPRTINIAVIALPHMANYTDFAELEKEPGVSLRYLTRREDLSKADVVILPGTKNTLGDLEWVWTEGWAKEILCYAKGGGKVTGICGGYQILGEEVTDPLELEDKRKKGKGLGLLPVRTRLEREKITERVAARYQLNGSNGVLEAYEIHMGRSTVGEPASPAFRIVKRFRKTVRETDGAATRDSRVWGTYLHGIFADPDFRRSWLEGLFKNKGIPHPSSSPSKGEGRSEGPSGLRDPYDAWANYLWKQLDIERIFKLAGIKNSEAL